MAAVFSRGPCSLDVLKPRFGDGSIAPFMLVSFPHRVNASGFFTALLEFRFDSRPEAAPFIRFRPLCRITTRRYNTVADCPGEIRVDKLPV